MSSLPLQWLQASRSSWNAVVDWSFAHLTEVIRDYAIRAIAKIQVSLGRRYVAKIFCCVIRYVAKIFCCVTGVCWGVFRSVFGKALRCEDILLEQTLLCLDRYFYSRLLCFEVFCVWLVFREFSVDVLDKPRKRVLPEMSHRILQSLEAWKMRVWTASRRDGSREIAQAIMPKCRGDNQRTVFRQVLY